jgi:two-component system OmpR family response regulator
MSAQQHILVVDDDDNVRDVLVEMIREHGYRVSWTVDGKSTREFLQGNDPVDVVVLDVLLPGESGADLALYVKKLGLALVMISGSPDALEFAEANNLQKLNKPFRSHELIDALMKALRNGEPGRRSKYP